MYEVAEITFEELGLEITPGVFSGMFSGTAHVDRDGAVCVILLDGYRDGVACVTRMEIPSPYQNHLDWVQRMVLVLRDQIETHYRPAIGDALDDWAEARGVREHEPQE